MDPQNPQSSVWDLAEEQHGVVSRQQLLALGVGPDGIKHRVARGRLHPIGRGVYAVGRRQVPRLGTWMAAVLQCAPGAALSHASAAALWGIGHQGSALEVSATSDRRPLGIKVYRRRAFEATTRHGIRVTTPACTIIDLAPRLARDDLEEMIGQADIRRLITPVALRAAAGRLDHRPGTPCLIATLDRRTFRLTRSKLERLFIPIALRAGYPIPLTRQRVNGFEVDFYWPGPQIVVETDGLTYHRTPAQQAKDTLRDQIHAAEGLIPLRFTHEQVAYDQGHVERILVRVKARNPVRFGGP
jgi:very-short-patch-repair endonuclease